MEEPIQNIDAAQASASPMRLATARDLRTDGSYRAILFDLDGTLLQMDLDVFLKEYYGSVARFVAKRGLDADEFRLGLDAGVKAMMHHDANTTNYQAFWDAFLGAVNPDACDWVALLTQYYETDFDRIGDGVDANPAANQLVKTLSEKGYPLVLATTPLFPLVAVEKRAKWAGIDLGMFARVTNYENSTAIKPSSLYYAENLAALGLAGEDVLMVGNNTVEDYSFAKLGADVYLAEDWLLNPNEFNYSEVPHGSFDDLLAWADALEECASPAANVKTGLVDVADRDFALVKNRKEDGSAEGRR